MVTQGAGWRLAGSLIQLGREVAAMHPDFTCLGTVGDAAHVNEGTASDHNPFIKDPTTGVGIVRAIDIGGPDAELKALRQLLWQRYADKDDRVYEFGYMKGCSDNLINNWGLPFGTHVDTGDAGHLHISVTQSNGNSPSASGYVAAIDDMRNWGIASQGAVDPAAVERTPLVVPFRNAAWPGPALRFGPHDYFGLITGPAASHGGYYANEKPYVRMIQQRLISFGFVPNISDTNSGWADGIFQQPTKDAVIRFQQRYRPGALTTLPGQFWSDDWKTLFSL